MQIQKETTNDTDTHEFTLISVNVRAFFVHIRGETIEKKQYVKKPYYRIVSAVATIAAVSVRNRRSPR